WLLRGSRAPCCRRCDRRTRVASRSRSRIADPPESTRRPAHACGAAWRDAALRRGCTCVMNDLKFAFRQLLKNPGFTAVALLTLALGLGACTAIFSLINAALLSALPFPDSDRLVVIWADNPGLKSGLPTLPPANADVAEWRDQSRSFAKIAAFSPRTADLADGGDPERVGAAGVTAGFFETLGVTPLLGRTLAPDEEAPGGPPVALISHGLWQRRFGGDPAVLGKGISIDGDQRTLI